MKYNKIIKAVIPGAIALAAILLSVSLPFNADTMLGYGAVLAVLGIAALEYGYAVKGPLHR